MLSVSEAISAILQEVIPLKVVKVPLECTAKMVLAETIVADRDIPPFDKSLMDGYAVRWTDLAAGTTRLAVVEEVTAGKVPTRTVHSSEAARIMTGAMLPPGADTVVRQEDVTAETATGSVVINVLPHKLGSSVLRQGQILKAGGTVLKPGRRLSAAEIGAIAEMGQADVKVYPRPNVFVLATGDELVPFHESPGVGQIRNSNEVMLATLIRQAGGEVHPLGIARDNPTSLAEKIRAGLAGDVLVLSGGVSAGKLDLVPSQLEQAGVRPILHQVWMKPGKPIWFGVIDHTAGDQTRRTYVFGLPGNPVSSLAGFELFVKTALKGLQGLPGEPQSQPMILADEFRIKGDRPTYQPIRWEWTANGPAVFRIAWQGSADLQGAAQANAMALFKPRETPYQPGERVEVFLWD